MTPAPGIAQSDDVHTARKPGMLCTEDDARRFNLLRKLELDPEVLLLWLQRVESETNAANAFHNSVHSASVLHCLGCLLSSLLDLHPEVIRSDWQAS